MQCWRRCLIRIMGCHSHKHALQLHLRVTHKILHDCRYDVALGFVQLPGMAERGPNRPLDARQSGDNYDGRATSRHMHPVSMQHAPC